MNQYRLVISVELERMSDTDASMEWRGTGNVQVQGDIVTLVMVSQRDGLLAGVQSMMQRIVSEENARHHG